MAYMENIKTATYEAGESLAAKQYYFVKLSAGKVVLATDGSDAIGILLNTPASGEAATVALIDGAGKCKILCGGTIAQDAYVASDGNGKAITAATSDVILGQALEAGASGRYITIALGHRGTALANGGYS